MMLSRSLPNHPAFLVRAADRAGFSAFFGVSLAVSLAARLPPPAIGSSISRWPAAAFFGFLPLAFAVSLAAGAAFSLARLRLSASIRLMTLPLDFGAALATGRPLRFWLISSISAVS